MLTLLILISMSMTEIEKFLEYNKNSPEELSEYFVKYSSNNSDKPKEIDSNLVFNTPGINDIKSTKVDNTKVNNQYSDTIKNDDEKDITIIYTPKGELRLPKSGKTLQRIVGETLGTWSVPKEYSDNKIVQSIKDSKFGEKDKNYLLRLAFNESRYDPKIVNRFGYKGLYQFGKSALDAVGMSENSYMNNVDMQHLAAIKLGDINYKYLKPYVDQYIGKEFNGVPITKHGIMAAAHLGGAGNVKKFFTKGIDFADGNGTKLSKYLNDFAYI